MPHADLLCLLFLIATVLLIAFAELTKPSRRSRIAGLAAIMSVLVTDYYLIAAVAHGDGWLAAHISRAFPQQSRRGQFDGGGGSSPGADGASGHSASNGSGSTSGGIAGSADRAMQSVSRWISARLSNDASTPPLDDVLSDCQECPELVRISAGELRVGSAADDPLRHPADAPAQTVSVWPGFAISRSEITAEQLAYARLPGGSAADCAAGAPNAAAACVTSERVAAYVAWLNTRTGKRYRLPTAAEWEFAARISESAVTRPDRMADGVAELVADCWPGGVALTLVDGDASTSFARCAHRVVKGAADGEGARWQRPAARRAIRSDHGSPRVGFRVLREIDARTSRAGE